MGKYDQEALLLLIRSKYKKAIAAIQNPISENPIIANAI